MVPNSHMDTYACELERSYTETVGNGRMDGPNGVRSHPSTPTRLLFLKYRVRTGTVPDRYRCSTCSSLNLVLSEVRAVVVVVVVVCSARAAHARGVPKDRDNLVQS